MEIEKINENQIKFMLNKSDLEERDIRISDLSYGSEKSQELFQEIMEEAVLHCDFRAEGHVPLVVEAVPMGNDCLMIIVTKTNGRGTHDARYDLMPRTRNEGKFIEKELVADNSLATADTTTDTTHGLAIYVFDSLDIVANAAARAKSVFSGASLLYKNANRFYLVLHFAANASKDTEQLTDYALNDFGQKHNSSVMTKTYLAEHGELLIPDEAVKKLAGL